MGFPKTAVRKPPLQRPTSMQLARAHAESSGARVRTCAACDSTLQSSCTIYMAHDHAYCSESCRSVAVMQRREQPRQSEGRKSAVHHGSLWTSAESDIDYLVSFFGACRSRIWHS